MIPLDEAQAIVLGLVGPLGTEEVPLRHAAGRVLAAAARAARDQPPYDASAMDGYAVIAADTGPGAVLRVVGDAPAGAAWAGRLAARDAVRIFTGAPLPQGADAVVIQENVTRDGAAIRLSEGVGPGRNIRARGSDFAIGETLAAPRRLRPAEIGLLAAMNRPVVRLARLPVVAILSTGDELVQPGEDPRPDQIIASNGLAIAAMVEAEGAVARLLPIAPDEEAALAMALDLAEGADLIVTIGGASVGEHDLMARAGGRLGLDLAFHKVAIRPGKPLLAGRRRGVPLIGLPGNPVSALVCALLFVVPAVRAMQGLPDPLPRPRLARLAADIGANGDRAHFMRARLSPRPMLSDQMSPGPLSSDPGPLSSDPPSPDRLSPGPLSFNPMSPGDGLPGIAPVTGQDSAHLRLFAAAEALLIRPAGDAPRRTGETVAYLPL